VAKRRRKRDADPDKVIGYIRVSTDEQALGPEAQREALNAWCEAHGARLCAVFEDIGVSGAIPLEKRHPPREAHRAQPGARRARGRGRGGPPCREAGPAGP